MQKKSFYLMMAAILICGLAACERARQHSGIDWDDRDE